MRKLLHKIYYSFIFFCVFGCISNLTFAADFPFCSSNQTEPFEMRPAHIVSRFSWKFPTCYTTPETLKVKINSISLVDSSGGEFYIYQPSVPDYIDLTQGLFDLVKDLPPISGTYSAIRIKMDNVWKIKAAASFTKSDGVIRYCRTKGGSMITNANLTINGVGTLLGYDNQPAVEQEYKQNAFNFESPNAVASENQCNSDYSNCTHPYKSKMRFNINAGGISYIDYILVNSSGALEKHMNSVTGLVYEINFTSSTTVTEETDKFYKLTMDISKAIGFAHEYEIGSGPQSDPQCNNIVIGPIPMSFTAQ